MGGTPDWDLQVGVPQGMLDPTLLLYPDRLTCVGLMSHMVVPFRAGHCTACEALRLAQPGGFYFSCFYLLKENSILPGIADWWSPGNFPVSLAPFPANFHECLATPAGLGQVLPVPKHHELALKRARMWGVPPVESWGFRS